MKRVIIGIAVVCLLVVAVMVFMPGLRQDLFGAHFGYALQVGRTESVVGIAQLLNGVEMRPISKDGNVLPNPEVNPDIFDVRISMQESVQSVGGEEVLTYNVDGVESQQIGTAGASDMIGNQYRLRLSTSGLPIELVRTEGKSSHVFDDTRLEQFLASWWPGFPNKRVKKGANWSKRWNAPLTLNVLDGHKIDLQHEVRYELEDVKVQNGMNVAMISYKGEVKPSAKDLPDQVEIGGTGVIEGKAYINITNGTTVVADERLVWSVVVRLLDEDMEVVQFSDRNSRLYRPRLVPNGDAGFQKQTAGDAGENGLPTAGSLLPKDGSAASSKQAQPKPEQQQHQESSNAESKQSQSQTKQQQQHQ